jgi:hypothetical protein
MNADKRGWEKDLRSSAFIRGLKLSPNFADSTALESCGKKGTIDTLPCGRGSEVCVDAPPIPSRARQQATLSVRVQAFFR